MQQVNLVLQTSFWGMNKMYSLVLTNDDLYLLHTGPGVRINLVTMQRGIEGAAAQMAVNGVIKRGLKKIHAAQEEITPEGLDAFVTNHKNSSKVPLSSLSKVQIANNKKKISFQTPQGKFTFHFNYCEQADRDAFLQTFPR